MMKCILMFLFGLLGVASVAHSQNLINCNVNVSIQPSITNVVPNKIICYKDGKIEAEFSLLHNGKIFNPVIPVKKSLKVSPSKLQNLTFPTDFDTEQCIKCRAFKGPQKLHCYADMRGSLVVCICEPC